MTGRPTSRPCGSTRARPSRRLGWITASTAWSSSGIRPGGTSPVEDERRPQAQPFDLAEQRIAKDAVADPDEPHPGVRRDHPGRDGQDVVVPLELEQPRHGGERHLVVGQAELATDLVARAGRVQEGVGVHAAIHREILLGPPDPGRQRLRGHGVAHADDRVAPSRRPPLERDVQPVPASASRTARMAGRGSCARLPAPARPTPPHGRGCPPWSCACARRRASVDGTRRGACDKPSSPSRGGSAGPARASTRPSAPAPRPASNRSPSGPSAGPVMSVTSSRWSWCSPSTVSRVFSCAPPRMSRVMTWTIRMLPGPLFVVRGPLFVRVPRRGIGRMGRGFSSEQSAGTGPAAARWGRPRRGSRPPGRPPPTPRAACPSRRAPACRRSTAPCCTGIRRPRPRS